MLILAIQGQAQAIPDGETYTLVILHNNDGESDLLSSDGEGGAALFAGLVADRKTAGNATHDGVVMVSSGDNFLAGPEWTAGVDAGVFYDALVLEEIGYDAIALGNHDFDFGPDVLADFIGSFTDAPTYVSANVDLSPVPELAALDIVKSTVVTVGQTQEPVGIVGAVTPNLPFISSPFPVTVSSEVAGLVQAEIDALTAQGVEIIILISHLQGIDEDIELAAQLTNLDVMVAGGGDELLANETTPLLPSDDPADIFGPYPILAVDMNGNDVPVVTTSGSYGYLGELVVSFNDQGELIGHEGVGPIRVLASDGITANAALEQSVTAPVTAALDAFETNVIAQSEVALDGQRSSIRFMETNQGNLIADSQLWQAQQLAPQFGLKAPQVAMGNGGGIRNDSVIPAGNVTELDTFDMVPFSNFLTILEDMSAAQIKDLLENAVSRVEGNLGGTGRFAQVAGISFTYDPEGTAIAFNEDGSVATPGDRVRSAVLDDGTALVSGGKVVPGAPAVTVTMVDFLARGGDQYPVGDHPFTVIGVSYQQALAAYIEGPLAGAITAEDYPEGGEGRVTVVDSANVAGVLPNGQWLVPEADAPFFFGDPGDIPFLGDWNGDGVRTPGLYRQSNGFAYVRDTNDFGVADREWFMGNPGDIPLVGDWDGDGIDSFGVYRPSEGKVYLRNEQTTGFAEVEYFFGNPGDTPFSGDFDGDGIDTVGLYRETAGLVYFRNEQTTGVAEFEFFFGAPGDIFVGGDWDGDGIDTVGVIRPSTNTFFGRNSNTQGFADFSYGFSPGLKPIVAQPLRSGESVIASKGLTTLATALDILEENGFLPPPGTPSTLFAPTDAAFEALPPGLLDAALADPGFLADIVGYHAVPGAFTQQQLIDAGFLTAFNGSPLGFSEGSLLVNGVEASPGLRVEDGYIFVIDEVLQPPEPEALFAADHMRGTTEVPAAGDPTAFGIAFFNYTILGETHLMCVGGFNTGGFVAGETPNALHIHEGAAGVAGPVVWNSGATEDNFFPGEPFNEWAFDACAEIDPAVAQSIMANPEGFYANIHSPSYPGGMAREQLVVDPGFNPFPTAFHADPMAGAFETGGGDPDAVGWVYLDQPTTDTGEWCFDITLFQSDPLTGAHIHAGAAGVDGGVVINFEVGTRFPVHEPFPQVAYGCVAVDATLQSDIAADPAGFYANFHSEAFPAGMVRGQLVAGPSPQVDILADLSGEEEVSAPGEGFGFARLAVFEELGAIEFFIDAFSTDQPTSGHVHTGGAGVEGPVLLDLGVTADTFSMPFGPEGPWIGIGVVTGVDPTVISAIVGTPGDEYINIHNDAFPAGIMRGQTFNPESGPPPQGLSSQSRGW